MAQLDSIFKWLALYESHEGLIFPLTAFFIVLDKQKILAILSLTRIGVFIPALITLSHWYDIETIAMPRTAVIALSVFVFYSVILKQAR